MSTWQAAFTALVLVLLLLVLAGLVVRGRWQRVLSLPAYSGVLVLAHAAVLLWPQHFYAWRVWLGLEAVVGLLGAAIAVEILLRVFAVAPAAGQVARRLLILIALATTVALCAVCLPRPSLLVPEPWLLVLAVDLLPRLAYATTVLCLLVLGLTWFYRLPLDPFHRAILYGFAPYVTLYAFSRGTTGNAQEQAVANIVNTAAYVLMLLLWVHAAWRPEQDACDDPALVRKVQPWRY